MPHHRPHARLQNLSDIDCGLTPYALINQSGAISLMPCRKARTLAVVIMMNSSCQRLFVFAAF